LLLLPAVFLLLLRLPPPPPVPLLLTLENAKPSALRQRSCPGQTPPFRAVQRPHENAMEREDAVKTRATSEHNTEAATRSKQVSEVRLRAGLEQAASWTEWHARPVTALDQEEGQQHLRAVARCCDRLMRGAEQHTVIECTKDKVPMQLMMKNKEGGEES
jgi:hypothetical protein